MMSKFFNETRKAEEWYSREHVAKKPSLTELLESPANTDTHNPETREQPIQDPRMIQILSSPETTHILGVKDERHDATESYRALRTRLMRLQSSRDIRSVVLSSGAPGEGKTLTTLNLALCCARLEALRVLVVDADLRSRGLTRLIGDPPAPGLAQVLSGQSQLQNSILPSNHPNLDVLAAGSPVASPAELFTGSAWKDLIGWCSSNYKLILVDSPPIIPLTDFELIVGGCDAILTVVRAHTTQREILRRVASHVDSKKFLGIIFNGAQNHSNNVYHKYYQ
jgi:protein-tyrosine kinase